MTTTGCSSCPRGRVTKSTQMPWHQGFHEMGGPYLFSVVKSVERSTSTELASTATWANRASRTLRTRRRGRALVHAGLRWKGLPHPGSPKRTVFVGFGSSPLTDIVTDNGGYADDIWFSRGGFSPNIVFVSRPSRLHAEGDRQEAGDVGFCCRACARTSRSPTARSRFGMEDAAIPYRDLPRAAPIFQPSQWWLSNITMDKLDLGARGKVYHLGLGTDRQRVLLHLRGRRRDSGLRFPSGNARIGASFERTASSSET